MQYTIMETDIPDAPEKTVAQYVVENHRAANVFKKYHIDFCCGGKKPLEQVCHEKGLNYNEVRRDLDVVMQHEGALPSQDPARWSAGFLADYIVETHHHYLQESLPVLRAYATKVARVHGERHPELLTIFNLYAALQAELETHLQKEEMVLFPYVRQLEQALRQGTAPERPGFQTVANPVGMLEHEHEDAGEILEQLRTLTDNYTPPADACNTYRVLFAQLRDLEEDLHQHIHLENNILFPKALAMEGVLYQDLRN